MSQLQKEVSTEPEVLSINVNDSVKSQDGFGSASLAGIFQNPKNDPRIAGMATVKEEEALKKLAPLAYRYSKEKKLPVILVMKAE